MQLRCREAGAGRFNIRIPERLSLLFRRRMVAFRRYSKHCGVSTISSFPSNLHQSTSTSPAEVARSTVPDSLHLFGHVTIQSHDSKPHIRWLSLVALLISSTLQGLLGNYFLLLRIVLSFSRSSYLSSSPACDVTLYQISSRSSLLCRTSTVDTSFLLAHCRYAAGCSFCSVIYSTPSARDLLAMRFARVVVIFLGRVQRGAPSPRHWDSITAGRSRTAQQAWSTWKLPNTVDESIT
ncbi:hypothetical protein DE146DRAFT_387766 [Phaeosphaeria sp. MPI-PUGE-AT-0046c]|nr:hypothetical protein DE146DRAFT_387766 [Phaeosphaeria sp. MPI-PUGE-AT-0046c]